MRFLVGECASGNLLLHPLHDPEHVLDVWERYRWVSDPAVFAVIVWRVVDARHVQAASEIVRSTPSHRESTLKPDNPKETKNVGNDGSNRSDGDDWRRGRQPGDRGRGRLVTRPNVLASGNPWD